MFTQYSHYGWRARIGLIIGARNTTMEPEFYRMAPEGVSIHAARVSGPGKTSVETYMMMAEATARAAMELASTDPSVVAYGCTSGTIIGGDEAVTRRIQEVVGGDIPVVTTATAVVDALRALGLRRVAVATPYVSFVNEAEKAYLEERGFEVTRILGLDLGHDEHNRRMIQRQPPGVAYRLGREADTPDADGLFISCTGLTAVPVIEQLESELGKPVVTSNQATFWAVLRRAGLNDRLEGLGKLLRKL